MKIIYKWNCDNKVTEKNVKVMLLNEECKATLHHCHGHQFVTCFHFVLKHEENYTFFDLRDSLVTAGPKTHKYSLKKVKELILRSGIGFDELLKILNIEGFTVNAKEYPDGEQINSNPTKRKHVEQPIEEWTKKNFMSQVDVAYLLQNHPADLKEVEFTVNNKKSTHYLIKYAQHSVVVGTSWVDALCNLEKKVQYDLPF